MGKVSKGEDNSCQMTAQTGKAVENNTLEREAAMAGLVYNLVTDVGKGACQILDFLQLFSLLSFDKQYIIINQCLFLNACESCRLAMRDDKHRGLRVRSRSLEKPREFSGSQSRDDTFWLRPLALLFSVPFKNVTLNPCVLGRISLLSF